MEPVRITGEQKLGAVILVLGVLVIVATQGEIERYPHQAVNVNPGPGYIGPLEFEILEAPSYILYQQMSGVAMSSSGFTLLLSGWLRPRYKNQFVGKT